MTNDLGIVEGGGKTYPLLEEKDYDAVVHGIVILGRHPVEFQGQKKEPQVFMRVILELPDVVRDDGTTATTGKKIKITSSVDKGNFAKFLQTLGLKVTEDNIRQYFSNEAQKSLLGKAVVASVAQWEKDGVRAASIREFAKLDPRLPQPKGVRGTFYFNPLSPDLKVFRENLTFRTQQEVMSALNANQFPRELHEAWAEIQIERENKQQDNKPQTKATEPHDSNNYNDAVDWNEESI